MRLLLTTAALGALMAASSAVPASAQQAADCGKYGMTCAPMGKNLNYPTGVQAKDCGLYGMTCPKGAATAAAAPATVTPRSGITTGRSVARTRVSTRLEARVRTAVAAPAATTIAAAPATTTTVRTGYQPQYSGYSYGYAQPAPAAYCYYAPAPAAYGYYAPAPAAAPVVTGRSVAVTTAAPAPVVAVAPTHGPTGWYNPQPWGYTYAQPARSPWYW